MLLESCAGFFFQKHRNGHEVCGFYAASRSRCYPEELELADADYNTENANMFETEAEAITGCDANPQCKGIWERTDVWPKWGRNNSHLLLFPGGRRWGTNSGGNDEPHGYTKRVLRKGSCAFQVCRSSSETPVVCCFLL